MNYFSTPPFRNMNLIKEKAGGEYEYGTVIIPFQLKERSDAVWWFTLVFDGLRNSFPVEYGYIRAFLRSPKDACTWIKKFLDDRDQFVIRTNTSSICECLLALGIDGDFKLLECLLFIHKLKDVFDDFLVYTPSQFDKLLRQWNVQHRNLLMAECLPDIRLVQRFLQTHSYPAGYEAFGILLKYNSDMTDGLKSQFEEHGYSSIDLREKALLGMEVESGLSKSARDKLQIDHKTYGSTQCQHDKRVRSFESEVMQWGSGPVYSLRKDDKPKSKPKSKSKHKRRRRR